MAYSLNKAIIVGRLGKDPELRQGPKFQYADFDISNTSFSNGQEEVQWHRIRSFGRQAEIVHEYLHKGDLCCIEGRIDDQTYEKDGEKRFSQSIIAERITFLSTKRTVHPSETAQATSNNLEEAFPG